MSDETEIAKLVTTLRGFKAGNPLKNYVTHIRFPKFKSIEPGTQIDFPFPLTALVGANGIGKSSALHALFGAPFQSTTAKFWFATELDPIEGTKTNPQRYVYGHWNESFGDVVETRKARIGVKTDYWEPYRASVRDGMKAVPAGDFEGKSKDRWNPVKRDVVYINLKATFGSFDRFFYFDDGQKTAERRADMQREARRLKSIKDNKKQSFILGRRERVHENRKLSADELKAVSRILGREYEAASLIRHSLYPGSRGEDLSVVFKRGTEYSEAFAGSGEIAAVSAVVDILKAKDYSLILLDEPETSLHPGAQRALLRFLLEQIKLKKHQVVISTHSSDFIEGLPNNAIKVFEDNGKRQARVLNECSPYIAFNRLGKPPANRRRILVEDPLAAALVLRAAKGLDAGEAAAIDVIVAPGGAESIIGHHGPSAMAAGTDVFILLDGDKKHVDEFRDPATVAPADRSKLATWMKTETGCKPNFLLAGGTDVEGNAAALVEAHLQYFGWLRTRASYLPKRCPEQVVLDALYPLIGAAVTTATAAKKALKTELAGDTPVTGSDLAVLQRVCVGKIGVANPDLVQIRTQLQTWLQVPVV